MRQQAVDAAQQRGLAATGRADHGEDFARADLEVDVAEDFERAVVLAQPFDADARLGAHRRGIQGGGGDGAHATSCGRLGRQLRPIIGGLLGTRERVFGLEAGRHRAGLAGEDLVVLDVQGAQPALLAHGDGDEIADLDQLGLAEMLVQTRPQLVARRQIPGDRLGIGERGLLPLIIPRRGFEIDQVGIVVFLQAGLGRLDRALVAAELAQHRTRDINAAEFLDVVVGDAVLEHVAPGIGERPERGRHMGAHRLALRPRGSFARAAVELRQHRGILDGGRIDVTDAGFRHRHGLSEFSFSAHRPRARRLRRPLAAGMLPQRPSRGNGRAYPVTLRNRCQASPRPPIGPGAARKAAPPAVRLRRHALSPVSGAATLRSGIVNPARAAVLIRRIRDTDRQR